MSSPATISVKITKREKTGLGFRVKDQGTKTPVVVNYIEPDGAAEQSGLLGVGHVIIAVNGTSLIDLPYPNALSVLRAVPIGSLTLLTVRMAEGHLPKQVIQNHNGINNLNNNGKYQYDDEDAEAVLDGFMNEDTDGKKDDAETQTRFATFNELKKSALRCFTGTNNPHSVEHSKVQKEDSVRTDSMTTSVVNGVEFANDEEEKLTKSSDKINHKVIANAEVVKCPFTSNFRTETEPEEKFFKLKNWENNEYCTDTLYKKSLKAVALSYQPAINFLNSKTLPVKIHVDKKSFGIRKQPRQNKF